MTMYANQFQRFALVCFIYLRISACNATETFDLNSLNLDMPDRSAERYFQDQVFHLYRADCITPEAIVFLLVNQFSFDQILQNDLYKHTNPLIIRSVHTEPSITLRTQLFPETCYAVTCKPYYRFTPKANFTSLSRAIHSYIQTNSPQAILNVIDRDWITNSDIPNALMTVAQTIIQGRELGGMFALQAWKDRYLFNVILPVLYLEYNFYLTPQQQEILEHTSFMGADAEPIVTPSRDYTTFKEEHLLCDQGGIGDLRLELWYDASAQSNELTAIAGQVTLPTAHAAIQGIMQICPQHLNKKQDIPFVDLYAIANLYCESLNDPVKKVELAELLVGYSITALDRLGAILLNNPLGQQHATIGTLFRFERPLTTETLSFRSSGELSYAIPSRETRFFKIKKNQAEFMRNYDDAAQAQQNLNFLSQQTTNTLYPSAVNVRVHPGWVLNITGSLVYTKPHYQITGGLDIWGKTPEHFGPIHYHFSPGSPAGPFDLRSGQLSGACQIKVFGSITSEISTDPGYSTRIGLRADATAYGYAIGSDMVLAGDFIIDF